MLKFRLPDKKKTSLEIPSYFAAIKQKDNNHYYFDIIFSLKKSDIVLNDIKKVEIKVYRNNFSQSTPSYDNSIPEETTFVDSNVERTKIENKNSFSKKTLNELTKSSRFFENSISKKSSEIATFSYPIIQYTVPAIIAEQIRSGQIPLKNIEGLYYTTNVIESLSDQERDLILGQYSDQNLQFDVRSGNLKLITEELIDPSSIVEKDFQYNMSQHAILMRDYYLNKSAVNVVETRDSFYKKITKKTFLDKTNFLSTIKIPVFLQDCILEFKVYNQQGFVIDSKEKDLSVAFFSSLFNTIKKPATVFSSINITDQTYIKLTQQDENADQILLKNKFLNNSGISTSYSDIGTFNVSSGNSAYVDAIAPRDIFSIYRCQSFKDGNNTCSYIKSFIVGKSKQVDSSALVIVDNSVENSGVTISVVNVPLGVSHYTIYKTPIINGVFKTELKKVVVQHVSVDTLSVIDANVKNKDIFLYELEYKFTNGNIRRSVNQIHSYINSSKSGIAIAITNPTVTTNDNNPVVSFNLETQIDRRTTNDIKSAFQASNLYDEFTQEIESIKDQFADLIMLKVFRLNLNTGIREVFSDIVQNNFFSDDSQSRARSSVSKLNPLHSYRYEIVASIRNPLSLLRDYVKPITVSVGSAKKTYYSRPYKWKNPKTLSKGVILAQDTNGNIISSENDIFDVGQIGTVASYTVSGISRVLSVNNLTAERVDLRRIRLSWQIESSLQDYDHFVVVKEINGIRSFLGPVYSQELIDDINEEVGSFIYYVTPIFADYSAGFTTRTECIVIEPIFLNSIPYV